MTRIYTRAFQPGAKRDPNKSNVNQSGFMVGEVHEFNADVNELSECQHCGWGKDHDIHTVLPPPPPREATP